MKFSEDYTYVESGSIKHLNQEGQIEKVVPIGKDEELNLQLYQQKQYFTLSNCDYDSQSKYVTIYAYFSEINKKLFNLSNLNIDIDLSKITNHICQAFQQNQQNSIDMIHMYDNNMVNEGYNM